MGLRPRKTASTVAALALALLALSGFAFAWAASPTHVTTARATPTPLAAPTARAAPVALAAPVRSPHPAVVEAFVNFENSTINSYTSLPATFQINVSVQNVTMTSSDANMSFTLYALIGSSLPYPKLPFASWPIPITATNQSTFNVTINDTNVLNHEYAWVTPGFSWPTDTQVVLSAFLTIHYNGTSYNATPAFLTNVLNPQHPGTWIIGNLPWAQLDSPSAAAPVSPGNVTVVASYSGDWISAVNISIYNSAKILVYGAILTSLLVGNLTVTALAPWLVVDSGTYTSSITLDTAYGTTTWFNSSFEVAKAVGPASVVYVNSTNYDNSTGASSQIISGWTPGETASLLLVVGIIIGLIVALVLGRMMWGTPPAGPAQPWSGSKSATECSVCHQSFATEEEMKEHQKTAHGM